VSARPLPINDDANRRYRGLLAITEAISSHANISELFKELPAQLRTIVDFDAVAVVLHDEVKNMLRLHIFETNIPLQDQPRAGEGGPVENSPAGVVWQTQQPMLITAVGKETRFPEYIARLRAENINTLYSIPLTSSERRLGAIAFGSLRKNAYGDGDLEFLRQVAKQVAVAIDNVLNLQSAASERDRNQLLLEVNNAVASNLDLRELIGAISKRLQSVIGHDGSGLAVWDEEIKQLRMHAVHTGSPVPVAEGTPIPMEGTPAGLCFTTRQTIIRDRVDFEEFHFPRFRQLVEALGIVSGCSVPLILEGRVIAVLSLFSHHEAAFNKQNTEFLEQIAGQLAIAVQNAVNFRQAERERDRKRLLLEINNAVVTNLSLADLLKAISGCLGKMFGHDAASLSLYDPALKQFRMHTFDFNYESTLETGVLFPVEGTPAGRAFATRQPIRVPLITIEEFPAEIVRHALDDGLRSGCSIPLIVHDEFLGVLEIASRRENAFSEYDAGLLKHIARQIAIAVQNSLNFERANHERERAQMLLEINNAITTNLDLHDLIRATSACLRNYFKHDLMGMSLLDEETNQLRIHSLDSAKPEKYLIEGGVVSMEGTLNGLAFKLRQPVVRNRLDASESSWPLAKKFFAEQGLQSACFIPMIWGDRVVGVLNLSCRREDAFSADDVALLTHIARQIAIAVQNSLNFDRAKKAKERVQILLEANNAVATSLDLGNLLRATSACLREYFNHDVAGLALYDENKKQLIVHAMERNDASQFAREGTVLPLEGTPVALAFNSGRPVITGRIDFKEFSAPDVRQAFEDGIRSGCNVPLIAQERTLGVLGLASKHEDAFSNADASLLQSIAGQIAIAAQNSINFERARKFEQRAARERDRIQLLLEINNAVVSNLNLKELVKTVSASLRGIMPHDAAGIALYDPDQNSLREYSNVSYKEVNAFREGDTIPIEGTPAGEVFTTGKPMLIRRPNPADYPADRYSWHPGEDSPKSACLALLVSHGRKLGIVGVSSTQPEKFTEEDLEFFSQISGQIALGVENSLQYREIEALKNRLAGEKLYLEEEIKTEYNFAEIVGQSSALREVLRQVETVAPTDSTVLLIGETGTGKELIARAIHNLSARHERTLVKLNCAAIPTGLLESELFGHEKGAFTGAIAPRVGRFELAHKGTLLLDEIGEIPLELQPKLLRVLQEHEFERLGSSRTIKTDARLIAATNCDLAQMVEEKRFRSDLFYRLNVFPIMIPPLRERVGDIPLLVSYFAQKHAARMNKKIQAIPSQTMAALSDYHWPGNVRELENFVERSVILSRGSELQSPLSELQLTDRVATDGGVPPEKLKLTTMDEMERSYIEEVLLHTQGSIGGKGGAAEILGLPASTLRSRMKKLGIR
jgi:formate hydrogenlyase transcriptional activator